MATQPQHIPQEEAQLSNYDLIMAHQGLNMDDFKAHMTGPLIAIVLHLIILPLVIMMVVIPAPEHEDKVEVQTFEETVVPPPPPPPPPDPVEVQAVDVVNPEIERPQLDEAPPEDISDPEIVPNPDPQPVMNIEFNNSPKTLSSLYSAFGTPGGGGGGGGGRGGGGLEGIFYDLKQSSGGQDNGMSVENFKKVMKEFVTSGWKTTALNNYFKPPLRLYANCFFIPRSQASAAPKAYRCDDKVKPSRWAAIYRGRVIAPKTGRYRFVGLADDALVVRFNNENVLDYGWTILALGVQSAGWYDAMTGKGDANKRKQLQDVGVPVPTTFYKYAKMPHWNKSIGGLAAGKIINVEGGKAYPIEILISEIPGGEFGAALLIEDVDMTQFYQKDATGAPILPLFRTANVVPSQDVQNSGQCPPFFPGGEIWRIAPAGYTAPEKPSTTNDDENLIMID